MTERTRTDHEQRIERVVRFIAEHLDEALAPQELAGRAAFSRFHFHRIFRGVTGETVNELVRRLRLTRAAVGLRDGAGVTQIALDAGYESVEAFSRAFKRASGLSPTQYRTAWPPPTLGRRDARVLFDPNTGHIALAFAHGGPRMNVAIESRPTRRYAFIRHTGPYEQIGDAFVRLVSWAYSQPSLAGPRTCFSLSYDDPESVPADALRSDACLDIGEAEIELGDGIELAELPAGRFAVHTLHGSYEGIGPAYQRLFGTWLPDSDEQLADRPCMEVYLNSPQEVPPEALRTELCLPLQG